VLKQVIERLERRHWRAETRRRRYPFAWGTELLGIDRKTLYRKLEEYGRAESVEN